MSTRTDPYTNFRFSVEIDSVVVAGFSEVSGLERELQTEEYDEGGRNGYVRSLPDGTQYPNLTLKRGLTDSAEFWDWIRNVEYGVVERRDGRIVVMDRTGKEVWAWAFREALPVKWTGPDLQADQGSVAFETVELTHKGLSKVSGFPR